MLTVIVTVFISRMPTVTARMPREVRPALLNSPKRYGSLHRRLVVTLCNLFMDHPLQKSGSNTLNCTAWLYPLPLSSRCRLSALHRKLLRHAASHARFEAFARHATGLSGAPRTALPAAQQIVNEASHSDNASETWHFPAVALRPAPRAIAQTGERVRHGSRDWKHEETADVPATLERGGAKRSEWPAARQPNHQWQHKFSFRRFL